MTSRLIVFSSIPWDFLWQRPQALTEELAVLFDRTDYLEPPPSLWGRVRMRLSSPQLSENLRPTNVRITQPPLGAIPYELKARLSGTAAIDRATFAQWFRAWAPPQSGVNTTLLVMTPWWWEFLLTPALVEETRATVIYDCFDDIPNLERHKGTKATLERQERGLVATASRAFTTSVALEQKMVSLASELGHTMPVHLLPNGVDFQRFQERRHVAVELPGRNVTARIGFVGGLGAWMDFELIGAIARQRPQYDFIYVGPILDYTAEAAVAALKEQPNVYFIGGRPYSEVPALIERFDLCLVPFLTGGRMATVNSNKFYQYLAAGKPIASTPVPEAVALEPFIRTAAGSESMLAVIDHQLALRGTPEGRAEAEARFRFAEQNSWRQRAQAFMSHLSPVAVSEV